MTWSAFAFEQRAWRSPRLRMSSVILMRTLLLRDTMTLSALAIALPSGNLAAAGALTRKPLGRTRTQILGTLGPVSSSCGLMVIAEGGSAIS